MGSEKRDRQREARLAKLEEEATDARRARTKRLGIRFAVAAVVIVGALFAYSVIAGDDDSDDDAAADDTTPEEAALTSAECSMEAPMPTEWSNQELGDEVMGREAPDPAPPPADTAPDALEVETLIEGDADSAGSVAGDCVYVHYVGKIPDGTVFDESWSRGQPLTLLLGQGMVIPGWDQGLVDVRIGERVRLVIGSDNAYGAEGGGETIPPNTPLVFEVDVVDIVPTELSAAAPDASSTETTAAATETTATTAAAETTTTAAPTG